MKLDTARIIYCDFVQEIRLRKAKKAIKSLNSRSKQREGQRKNKIFFNNLWVFDISVLLPAIKLQYLYDSVFYVLKVWVYFIFTKFGFPLFSQKATS